MPSEPVVPAALGRIEGQPRVRDFLAAAVREGRLSVGRAVLLGVLHLFFVFDVIGAAVEYAFFRAADSKNKLQQEGIHS